MTLRAPTLDDRTFDQLFAVACDRVKEICPEWELSPSDPGVVLLDVFAHLTEVLIYRLNRVPEKAYVEFLNLLGLRLQPPTAASVNLVFRRSRPSDSAVEIPRGTRVTVARPTGNSTPPTFTTARAVRIEPNATEAIVVAYHAELVEAELAGYGSGRPMLSVSTRRAPIVAATVDDLELIVGIEATEAELEGRARAFPLEDKKFRVWTEVDNFANLSPDQPVFVVDRMSGLITFAPALRLATNGVLDETPRALGAVPGQGREIRVSYWRGGGSGGNVAKNTLTVLKDAIAGVSVTNPERATGGRDGETLENAITRGPVEFRSLERAVTASDYELFAKRSGAVARAKAVTRADVWAHAAPGAVEVLLVPDIPADALAAPLDAVQAVEFQNPIAQRNIQQDLDCRRPLGTTCVVSWGRCKTVHVNARVVAYREENQALLAQRFRERLYKTINPVAWRFGEPLRASHIYNLLLSEPGVSYVDSLRFTIDDAPNADVSCIVADRFQSHTFFAASGSGVFRSTNDGDGWERCAAFAGESVTVVATHPRRAGLVAAATLVPGDTPRSALYISEDGGETWSEGVAMAFRVQGAAWTLRDNTPVLFMATHVGLYEVTLGDVREPMQVLVDPAQPNAGYGAVAVVTDVRGGVTVAVATQDNTGVYLSSAAGKPGSFRNVGLRNQDVRALAVQYDGPRAFLWAAFATTQNDAGTGAARLELIGSDVSAEGWTPFTKNWQGGSCWSLAFHGTSVYAASYQAGVLQLDVAVAEPSWVSPPITCGLPQRGVEHIFQWTKSVATDPERGLVICGGPAGVYRSTDGGSQYESVSATEYDAKVTLPPTWLFCSGTHTIDVVEEP